MEIYALSVSGSFKMIFKAFYELSPREEIKKTIYRRSDHKPKE